MRAEWRSTLADTVVIGRAPTFSAAKGYWVSKNLRPSERKLIVGAMKFPDKSLPLSEAVLSLLRPTGRVATPDGRKQAISHDWPPARLSP